MPRKCPYCRAELPSDAPEQECPVCHNIVRPPNPARPPIRVGRAHHGDAVPGRHVLDAGARDTGWWIGVIFGAATLSGIYLMITMYHFFKAG
jgi:hypothetical protein